MFDEKANLLPKSAPERVVDTAKAAAKPGLEVQLGGQAIEQTEQPGFGISTAVGLLAAIVVLLLTFGSLIAMGLPIVTALFGLGTGLGLIALFTHVVDTADFSSELAAMIGLGVGIDYALFILTRFREAFRTPGPTFHDVRAVGAASIDTAGRAVLFAGTTVVIALLGMMLLGVDFLYGVAIAASIGVLLVMLASLTLLPALLTIAGEKVAYGSRRAASRAAGGRSRSVRRERRRTAPAIDGAARRAARRPHLAALEPLRGRARRLRWPSARRCVMLAIAAPAIALRLGSSDAANDPSNADHPQGLRAARRGLRPGLQRPAARGREGAASEAQPSRRSPAPSKARRASPRSCRRKLNPDGQRRDDHRLSRHPRRRPTTRRCSSHDLRDRVLPPIEHEHRREGLRRRRDRGRRSTSRPCSATSCRCSSASSCCSRRCCC